MKRNRDVVSFIHGILNLVWPIFAYDLAQLASLTIWGYGWTSFLPMTVMLVLPIVSDVIAIAIAAVRYYRRQSLMAMLGIIFDMAALAIYWFLRVQMQFSLGWLSA